MNDVSWVARALGPRDATVTRDQVRVTRDVCVDVRQFGHQTRLTVCKLSMMRITSSREGEVGSRPVQSAVVRFHVAAAAALRLARRALLRARVLHRDDDLTLRARRGER